MRRKAESVPGMGSHRLPKGVNLVVINQTDPPCGGNKQSPL